MKTVLGAILLALIFGAQLTATLSNGSIYPLSPYRMFSKHWPNGVQMTKVRLETAQGTRTPWEALPIPFFQANQFMYSIF